MLLRDQALAQQHIVQAGFTERTITISDSEVTQYDQAVSAAAESGGFHSVVYSFFRYVVPSTSVVRVVNGMIPRIKLYAAAGTELPAATWICFGIKSPTQPVPGIWFAFKRYTSWKNVAAADQTNRLLNEGLALEFENSSQIQYWDIKPSFELIIAVSGTATLVDKDYATHLVEFDVGLRTVI